MLLQKQIYWFILYLFFPFANFVFEVNGFCFLCSEADEIYKICSVIGNPNENSWAEGLQLADVLKYQFPQVIYLLIACFAKINSCFLQSLNNKN